MQQLFKTNMQIDNFIRRFLDIIISVIGIVIFLLPVLCFLVISSLETYKLSLFSQKRVGKDASIFTIYKIRTMIVDNSNLNTITTKNDNRITVFGKFLRKYKLDELPQLINVLKGEMSIVGPRPDVPKYIDLIKNDYEEIFLIRPGITSPASLKYINEELLLSKSQDIENFNKKIFSDKLLINKRLSKTLSIEIYLKCIFYTFFIYLKIKFLKIKEINDMPSISWF